MSTNYLIVYKTGKFTGSYFTNLTVGDETTVDDWVKFSEGVKGYLMNDGAVSEDEVVVLLNIVKLNDVEN